MRWNAVGFVIIPVYITPICVEFGWTRRSTSTELQNDHPQMSQMDADEDARIPNLRPSATSADRLLFSP
jgi:hypothetical protein